MAFLDNSGDIILDAVLTDTGRHRMARGDFRITKFALGDDEVDYSLYNKNHPSGSAYYDLEILKTPVLESFTNNSSMMKSKLVTIGRNDFLYMPILKLMDGGNPSVSDFGAKSDLSKRSQLHPIFRSYVITVGTETDAEVNYSQNSDTLIGTGIIIGYGNTPTGDVLFSRNPNAIVVETGIDTTDIPPSNGLSADLLDNGFIIEMDNRLGSLVPRRSQDVNGTTPGVMPVSYIDDDGIASYIITNQSLQPATPVDTNTQTGNPQSQHRIRGPRGRMLQFSILPNVNLKDSDYFFDRLGGTFTGATSGLDQAAGSLNDANIGFKAVSFKFIDTFVRVTGMTTGYTIDIPIRYVKKG